MIYRLHLSDWRAIGHYLGILILIVALAMVAPFVIALVLGEYDAAVDFLFSIGVASTTGAALAMCRIEHGTLDWRQSLVITGLCWVVLSLVGALPLYLSENYASFLDAFFDAVSAFTTTGMSLCIDVDHMAASVALWRCIMHLMGGVGVVVIALALGIFGTGAAAAALYRAEAREGQVMPEIKQTSRFILILACVIVCAGTLVSLVPMLACGMDAGSALLNAFGIAASSFSTGGMSNHALGIMYYHSWPLELITITLAALGCVNFVLYGDLWKGKTRSFFKDVEIRTVAIWGLVLVILLALALSGSQYFSSTAAQLRRGLYEVLSGMFNLGFSTLFAGQALYAMGSGALFVIVLSMVICGCSSSASGGIKAFRIGIIVASVAQTIREALAPDRARPRTFYYQRGKHLLSSELVSSAMIIMLLYIVTYCVGAVAGVVCGYDVLASMFDSVSAASNTGLSMGVAGVEMPLPLKVVYIFEMWLGRLEFIAIFAMFLEMFAFVLPHKRTYLFGQKGSGRR